MAEKLSVQIALEGGAEIQRQLADIGAAGQKAFSEIEKSASQVGGFKNLKPEEVTTKLKSLGVEGTAAFDKIQQAVQKAGRFERLVVGLQALENGFAKAGQAALALGRAAGPIGVALAAGIAVAAKGTISFAEALAKASVEAIKLGTSLEQFEKLRQSLQGIGLSAKEIGAGLANVQSDIDKFNLDRVKKNFEELKAAGEGVGAGTRAFRELQEVATQFTPAGKAAAEALVKLGAGVPGTTHADVRELGTELAKLKGLGVDIKVSDDATTRMQKILEFLRQMPDSAQRTEIAMAFLGKDLGAKFIQSLKAAEGSLPKTEANAIKLTAAVTELTNEWDRFGSVTFAPQITAGINLVTNALRTIREAVDNFSWDTFSNAAVAAFNLIIAVARNMTFPGLIAQAIANIPWGAMASKAGAAALQIIGGFRQMGIELAGFASKLPGIAWDMLTSAGGAAWDWIKQKIAEAKQAISDFAASLPGIAWDSIKSAGAEAWAAIKQGAADAKTAVLDFAASLPGIAWETFKSAGLNAINAIIDKLKELLGLKQRIAPAEGGGGGGGGFSGGTNFARGGFVRGRGSGTSDSNLAWVSRGEHIMPARVVRQPGVLSFLEALRRSGHLPGFAKGGVAGGKNGKSSLPFDLNKFVGVFNRVIDQLGAAQDAIKNADLANIENLRQINNALVSSIKQAMGSLAAISQTAYDALIASAKSLSQSLAGVQNTIKSAANTLQSLQGAGGKARGGLIGGRGSGTSDSNLAWLSRGEYVTPARAVRQPGVLAFLEALRRSGGNLSRVLDGMGQFALGGLVPRPMPAFAAGGLSGGMSNVTIQFPGLPEIGGLRASSSAVDELRKAAALAQVRSGGRKPSRYS